MRAPILSIRDAIILGILARVLMPGGRMQIINLISVAAYILQSKRIQELHQLPKHLPMVIIQVVGYGHPTQVISLLHFIKVRIIMICKFEVEDIARIMNVEDDIERFFPCDKGEWVQWLMGQVENPNIFIAGDVGDEIKSYIVACNAVMPPVSNSICIVMFYSSGDIESNMELVKLLNKWSREKGAREVVFTVDDEKILRCYHKYGAALKGFVGGWSL